MKVSPVFALQQGPVVAALARTAWKALRQKKGAGVPPPPTTPGLDIHETVAPRPPDLVKAYIRHVGGDPSAYRGTVPFHLFPQWAFPCLGRTLDDVRYDLLSILNGGCRATINAPLPAGKPLLLKARLDRVDANERRAVLVQHLETGPTDRPDALVVEQTSLVPFPRMKGAKKGKKKTPARVPETARELGRFRVGANSGLEFALLTGDFNPLHWVRPYAQAFGHPTTILHGFSTMARSIEILNRALWAGDVSRLRSIDVRFARPLRLPGDVGVYVDGKGGLTAGAAPGGPAYLTGTYTTR